MIVIFIFSIGCLIELKFCEVSPNSFFKQILKVSAFCLEKQKSFIPKRNVKLLSISKQKSFVYRPNFQWRFWLERCPTKKSVRSSLLYGLNMTRLSTELRNIKQRFAVLKVSNINNHDGSNLVCIGKSNTWGLYGCRVSSLLFY